MGFSGAPLRAEAELYLLEVFEQAFDHVSVVAVLGDGNCLWRAIAKALDCKPSVVLQILVHYLVHYKDQVLRHYDGNSRRAQEREWRRDVRAFSRLMQGPNALEENVHRLEMRWGDPARHGPILAAALGRPIVYIGISFWQSQKRASAGLGMTQHSLQRFSGTSSANATTQDLLPILALTPSVGVKDLAATALRNCEQDTIFLLHGWDAQHYNLVDTRPPMAPQ